jgi:dTDP-4-dehydrorhamnose 3,5-epimerase
MEVIPAARIDGALVFRPSPHTDERGFFSRTFDAAVARAAGIDPCAFVQDSISRSARGVVRGLHLRGGQGEAKLVRCSYGAVFDVIVDLRPGSPTYLNWESFDLADDSQVSLYLPAGCAHGFQALTEPADVSYRIDREHDAAQDVAIAYDDKELAIPWPLPARHLSARDLAAPSLAAVLRQLTPASARADAGPAGERDDALPPASRAARHRPGKRPGQREGARDEPGRGSDGEHGGCACEVEAGHRRLPRPAHQRMAV